MGLIRGVARTAVVAGTATAVSNRVSRRQAGRWAEQEAQQYAPPPPQQYAQPTYAAPPPPPPQYSAPPVDTSGTDDAVDLRIARLRDLAALRDQGVLTDAEFEVQKEKILQG